MWHVESAGGHDMEGASRVQRARRVTSCWRRTGCVLQVLRRAVEVLRQAVSTAPETGVETGKHFLSLSVNTNVSTASQRRTNTSAIRLGAVIDRHGRDCRRSGELVHAAQTGVWTA